MYKYNVLRCNVILNFEQKESILIRKLLDLFRVFYPLRYIFKY